MDYLIFERFSLLTVSFSQNAALSSAIEPMGNRMSEHDIPSIYSICGIQRKFCLIFLPSNRIAIKAHMYGKTFLHLHTFSASCGVNKNN